NMLTKSFIAVPEIDGLVDSARALIPSFRELEPEAERQRTVHAETIDQLRRNRLFRVLQPVRYGGMGASLPDFVAVGHEIARGSASAGWIFGNVALHSWIIGMFPGKGQDEFWSNPDAIASSCLRPTGIAERASGGFKIKGRWL